jgi:hypothetical protein
VTEPRVRVKAHIDNRGASTASQVMKGIYEKLRHLSHCLLLLTTLFIQMLSPEMGEVETLLTLMLRL